MYRLLILELLGRSNFSENKKQENFQKSALFISIMEDEPQSFKTFGLERSYQDLAHIK